MFWAVTWWRSLARRRSSFRCAHMSTPPVSRSSFFFFSSRRRHTRLQGDWSSDVCSSDLSQAGRAERLAVATVAALRGAGMAASLQSVAALDAEQLRHHRRVLFVASTFGRSEERRVGKECRSRWSPDHLKKKKKKRRR